MVDADTLAALTRYQDRILAHFAAVAPLLQATEMPDAKELAARRWQLTRILREYQIFKHNVVFDPAIALSDPQARDQAERMKARCIAMGEAFQAYTLEWCRKGATGRWRAYRRAAQAMIARLRTHLAQEAQAVSALLAHIDAVAGRTLH